MKTLLAIILITLVTAAPDPDFATLFPYSFGIIGGIERDVIDFTAGYASEYAKFDIRGPW